MIIHISSAEAKVLSKVPVGLLASNGARRSSGGGVDDDKTKKKAQGQRFAD